MPVSCWKSPQKQLHLNSFTERKIDAKLEQEEAEFARANATQREQTLGLVKAAMLTRARARLDAVKVQLSRRTRSVVERDALVAGAKYNLIIRPSRTASHIKDRAVPEAGRSRAYPAPNGW